ncbi:hypothetical protein [Klebsiella variicola]|uniref:hypothetical protein n=1 Tax=Klebsiella variicola TaxID=244366 RepID=UPI0034DFE1FF
MYDLKALSIELIARIKKRYVNFNRAAKAVKVDRHYFAELERKPTWNNLFKLSELCSIPLIISFKE